MVQIKAVLHQPEGPSSGSGANSPLLLQQPHPTLSRREYKRVRQACKVLSDALHSLRTLLHYLHALGMWPQHASTSTDSSATPAPPSSSTSSSSSRRPRSDSNLGLGLSPQDTDLGAILMAARRGAGGGVGGGAGGPVQRPGAPSRLLLDLGLCRVKGHYSSGLIFQASKPAVSRW